MGGVPRLQSRRCTYIFVSPLLGRFIQRIGCPSGSSSTMPSKLALFKKAPSKKVALKKVAPAPEPTPAPAPPPDEPAATEAARVPAEAAPVPAEAAPAPAEAAPVLTEAAPAEVAPAPEAAAPAEGEAAPAPPAEAAAAAAAAPAIEEPAAPAQPEAPTDAAAPAAPKESAAVDTAPAEDKPAEAAAPELAPAPAPDAAEPADAVAAPTPEEAAPPAAKPADGKKKKKIDKPDDNAIPAVAAPTPEEAAPPAAKPADGKKKKKIDKPDDNAIPAVAAPTPEEAAPPAAKPADGKKKKNIDKPDDNAIPAVAAPTPEEAAPPAAKPADGKKKKKIDKPDDNAIPEEAAPPAAKPADGKKKKKIDKPEDNAIPAAPAPAVEPVAVAAPDPKEPADAAAATEEPVAPTEPEAEKPAAAVATPAAEEPAAITAPAPDAEAPVLADAAAPAAEEVTAPTAPEAPADAAIAVPAADDAAAPAASEAPAEVAETPAAEAPPAEEPKPPTPPPPAVPTSEPLKLTLEDVNDSSVTIKWRPPETIGNSGLDGYTVEYCKDQTPDWVVVNEKLTEANRMVISDLTKGDLLHIRVVAVNVAGHSPPAVLAEPVKVTEIVARPKVRLPRSLRSRIVKQVGDQVNLVIPFNGKPKPLVTWTKDGEPLDTKTINVRNSEKDSILFIRTVDRSHSGTYQLSVKVESFEDKASIVIQIVDLPGPPASMKLVDNWGFSAALEWAPPKDTGNTEITGYTIQKSDKKTGEWFTVLEHYHRLSGTISDLVMGNSYGFRVFAENKCGTGKEATVAKGQVTIDKIGIEYTPPEYPAFDFSEAPKFTAPLNDHAATVGYTTRLLCAVRGTPKPKIEWLKNQMIIGDDPKFRQISNQGVCSLEIRKPCSFDGGIYTCRARNPHGEAAVACKLEVRQVILPEAVKGRK
ncbi:myosin-binding protein H-like isoform X3 [Conger conger]|uniref:myosin-binding protein H-like isoform X3 n=1 Tax=Conger conger TaxID=82655 RepID=UPI002A5AE4C2|nr:myosin-binding protein H-like isoform X3 [Conger conger]